MRTQIKLHLKRLISLGIAFALLLSTISISETIAYAAENDFDEVTLALSSNVVNDDTIDLYLLDEVHYISIDDLCRLTRSTKSVDGDVISVTQGIWRAEFNTANQTFNDGYQMVDITVLEISKGDYAVPALMFLSYYKAMAMIKNDVLYCELPECTVWEALDLDYSNSLVDIYELYGGEGNVELSLTLDILMDFIMGKNPTTEKYLKSAYYEALDVDIYLYDAVEQYVNERNEAVYNDLVAEETQSLLESLSNICGAGDTTNKITQEAMDLYILFHCTGQTRDFYNLAYNAMEIGDTTSVRRYADQIASVWREGEFQKSLVKNNAKSVEGAFFLLSSAVEAAQQVKYTHQENNLVYRVMGQENMKKLSLDVGDNEWYTVANVYKSTATTLQNSFVNILEDLQTMAINDLVSEAAGKIGVDTFLESAASKATGIKGIKAASWKIGLEVGRGAVQLFSWIDSLAEPDSLVDILFVDVGAYEADRLALYLSELQQNVYWVLCNERDRMYNNLDDATAYQDYIYAQQLYCRTSIAMYENLIAMNDEFGSDKDYWRSLFRERIDMLAVSLYQLTTIQDDGVNACLPLDLETFVYDVESIDAPNSFVYVDVGTSTAALTQNGDLYMWGMNDDGELGNGTTTDLFAPQKIMTNISYVTCNGATTAAIDQEGNLYMWGNNEYGTVGIGTAQSVYLPTKVLDNVKSVEFGGSTVYALTNDGELYTWGMNTWGQVGNGNETDQFTPYQVMSNVIDVVWCYNHVFAISESGDLYSWGFNRYGQLGNGSITNQSKPIKVLSNVNSVCGGREFSGAVTNSGELYMWGRNNYGQLGDGTTIDRLTPVRIMTDVVSADVNEYQNALAITTDDSLYVWGYNFYGQVGNGTEKVQNKPVRVLTDVIYATIGYSNVAAITSSNELYIWGDNVFGQIGDGKGGFDSLKQTTPKKVMENVRQVIFPSDRNVLAISLSGDLYSWGEGENGKTGNGKTSDQHTPALILENVLLTYSQGAYMNAITADGELFVWGYNMYGQLGTGSKKDQLTPYEIDISDISDDPIIQAEIQEMDGGIYAAFIEDGGYLTFIDGSDLVEKPSEYTVVDIDQDGTPELLLNADDGSGFCMTYIFSMNSTTQSIDLVDSIYSYAGISYSEPNRCITYCYPKPTAMEGGREFFKLTDGKFILTFGIYYTVFGSGGNRHVQVGKK